MTRADLTITALIVALALLGSAWVDGAFTPASTAFINPHAVEDAAGKGGCCAD